MLIGCPRCARKNTLFVTASRTIIEILLWTRSYALPEEDLADIEVWIRRWFGGGGRGCYICARRHPAGLDFVQKITPDQVGKDRCYEGRGDGREEAAVWVPSKEDPEDEQLLMNSSNFRRASGS